MKRFCFLVSFALIGIGISGLGCGSSGSDNPATGTGGTVAQTGGTVAPTGGSTAVSIEAAVPKDNDVPGWVVDTENSKSAGAVAAFGETKDKSEALIDGSASEFYKSPYSAVLAWQNYKNPSNGYAVDLHIWEMPSVELAKGIYADLMKNPLYSNNTWTPLTGVGEVARITNTGTTWWVNLQSAKFVVEIVLDKPPLGSEESDTVGHDVAIAYATELAKKLK